MFDVKCIKCGNKYQDKEPDDYYCPTCLEAKNKIAKEIDLKVASRPKRQVESDLARYDKLPKNRGFVSFNQFMGQ